MTFQPVLPAGGLVGWRFLQRTYDAQNETFQKSPAFQRDTDYFRENIKSATTAEDLVSDRRLLRVALGAFGLQDDIDSKAFIQKILESPMDDSDALANRLADDRYAKFSQAFRFGEVGLPSTQITTFADEVVGKYLDQQFELAIGTQDDSMRVALYAERELATVSQEGGSAEAQWFTVMGTPPLRELMEKALGLPTAFGQLDIDKQGDVFREKSRVAFGTDDIGELSQGDTLQKVIQTYLVRSQLDAGEAYVKGSIALTLLQSAG